MLHVKVNIVKPLYSTVVGDYIHAVRPCEGTYYRVCEWEDKGAHRWDPDMNWVDLGGL